VSGDCDRARQWASTELDGELSTFERVLLRAHLGACPSCREFRDGIGGLTGALRAAPLEEFEGVIEIGRLRRRRPRLRFAPAAAAMAVAAVGLGSILATTAVRSGSVGGQTPTPVVKAELASLDTMNLSTSTARERQSAFELIRAINAQRSLRGGPVVRER
jgi:predicted anti-sigma-YlaC factor YlaD